MMKRHLRCLTLAAIGTRRALGTPVFLAAMFTTGSVSGVDEARLAIGDRVRAAVVRGLRVRDAPEGLHLATQPAGAEGVITGGPGVAGGTEFWWEIDWERGTSGWSAESYLVHIGRGKREDHEIATQVGATPPPVPMPAQVPEEWLQWRTEMGGIFGSLRTQVGLLTSQAAQFEAGLAGLQTRLNALRADFDLLQARGVASARSRDWTAVGLGGVAVVIGLGCLWRVRRLPSPASLQGMRGELSRLQHDLRVSGVGARPPGTGPTHASPPPMASRGVPSGSGATKR